MNRPTLAPARCTRPALPHPTTPAPRPFPAAAKEVQSVIAFRDTTAVEQFTAGEFSLGSDMMLTLGAQPPGKGSARGPRSGATAARR